MLKVESLYKSYDDNNVLKGVSFCVERGNIYGLIGKNGAGKTTIMNILAGLLDADRADITFDGKPLDKSADVTIGYLPDLPVFFEYMRAGEYIDFLLMNGDKEARDNLLNMVGISGNVKIDKMSRGMRQRLGIAAALTKDPDIILMDEPSSALDPKGREDVNSILENLKNDKRVIVFSSHILSDVERVCDDFGFLSDGVIVPRKDIIDEKILRMTVIFDKPAGDLERFASENLSVTKLSPVSYRFVSNGISVSDAQKKVLEIAGSADSIIKNMINESVSADYLFGELGTR